MSIFKVRFFFVVFVGLLLSGCPKRAPGPEKGGPSSPEPAPDVGVPLTRAEVTGKALQVAANEMWDEEVAVELSWTGVEALGHTGSSIANGSSKMGTVAIQFRRRTSDEVFATYYIAPWQTMSSYAINNDPALMYPALLTVTPNVMLFGPVIGGDTSEQANQYLQQLFALIEKQFNLSANQSLVTPLELKVPKELRVMSVKAYPNYILLQVAEPGSGIVNPPTLMNVAPKRMLMITLTPDMGPPTQLWIAPSQSPQDDSDKDMDTDN